MDDAAFLRTVCEAPFDDGPRLVYADALDERGECERAEFIRVQCSLANHAGISDSWTSALRWREWELLLLPPPGSGYSRAEIWTPEALRAGAVVCEVSTDPPSLRSLWSGMAWNFRRGFVTAVTLTCEQFFGVPCGRCGGEGRLTTDTGGNVWHSVCPACSGTGRVKGVAAALFAQAPVTEVRLSDREPDSGSDGRRAWWYTDPDWHRPGARRHWLPVELRPYLTGSTCGPIDEPRPGVCGFDYGDLMEEADGVKLARADCSAACVALGRARANLPALTRPASANFFR